MRYLIKDECIDVVDIECVSKDGMCTKSYRVTVQGNDLVRCTSLVCGLRESVAGAICGVEMNKIVSCNQASFSICSLTEKVVI